MSGAEFISYPYDPPNPGGSNTKTTYMSQPIYDAAPQEILAAILDTQQITQTTENDQSNEEKDRTLLTTTFEKVEFKSTADRRMQFGGAVAAIVVTDEPNLFIAELTSPSNDERFPALPNQVWVKIGRIAEHLPTVVKVEVSDRASFSGELSTSVNEATRQLVMDEIHRTIGRYVGNLPKLVEEYRKNQTEIEMPAPESETTPVTITIPQENGSPAMSVAA